MAKITAENRHHTCNNCTRQKGKNSRSIRANSIFISDNHVVSRIYYFITDLSDINDLLYCCSIFMSMSMVVIKLVIIQNLIGVMPGRIQDFMKGFAVFKTCLLR